MSTRLCLYEQNSFGLTVYEQKFVLKTIQLLLECMHTLYEYFCVQHFTYKFMLCTRNIYAYMLYVHCTRRAHAAHAQRTCSARAATAVDQIGNNATVEFQVKSHVKFGEPKLMHGHFIQYFM